LVRRAAKWALSFSRRLANSNSSAVMMAAKSSARSVSVAATASRTRSHCGAGTDTVIVDSLGVPLDMGRKIRYANRAQRRALAVRDGGCVWLGCDMPVGWTDAHHITPWEHGGPTDLANLALLCRHHHGVTHRTGWTMTAHADQTFTWLTPGGQTLHSQRHRGRPPDP